MRQPQHATTSTHPPDEFNDTKNDHSVAQWMRNLQIKEGKYFLQLGIPCPGYQKDLKWPTRQRTPTKKARCSSSAEAGSLSDWTNYTFSRAGSSTPHQSVVDLFCSEIFDEVPSSYEASHIDTVGDGSLTSPLSFDDISREMNLQSRQTPRKATFSKSQTPKNDSIWPSSFTSISDLQFDGSSSLGSPNPMSLSCQTPLAQPLQDHSSILVEYYFREVCGMMSCYDGQLNPYRTTISDAWSGSSSLYYITQSMAAACLSDISPKFSSVGLQLQKQASICLSEEIQEDQIQTSSLLALVMLGMSRSWHNPGEVGQSEFEILATTLLSSNACQGNTSPPNEQKMSFFQNSLVYWQLLLAFVSDREPNIQGMRQKRAQPAQSDGHRLDEPLMPHPQTGVGIEIQMLVAKVGCLVRKERKRIRSRRFASRNDINQAHKAILEAEQLQSLLCAIQLPHKDTIADSGDEMTPPDHLLKIAEAYRCTGLLQLYRNFPDLLLPYSSLNDPTHEFITFSPDRETSSTPDAKFPENAWLIYLALHILDMVQDIPVSSTSRSIQPFLLVSICSELALDCAGGSAASAQQLPLASLASSPRLRAPVTQIDIVRARKSIISRLSCFENMLAAKPIRQMLLLVKETWACMETDQSDVYWMDVMIEKGYTTLMG
ncbi:hypothetical protein N7481_003207 [Penicillium waksmanii]|uniref:uncharacterized protein n=1 Tax=Penicillium waksmanii TaxID=69791 RepID=UPI002547046F|nr:uncharacterized protein N7481_003207 [Penicillium waksmanii]KAJ5987997.1 hypothetical protein N7481_003207 [Penicillium waksmanii]